MSTTWKERELQKIISEYAESLTYCYFGEPEGITTPDEEYKAQALLLEFWAKVCPEAAHTERDRCIRIAQEEKVEAEETGTDGDRAYNQAIDDVCRAILTPDSASETKHCCKDCARLDDDCNGDDVAMIDEPFDCSHFKPRTCETCTESADGSPSASCCGQCAIEQKTCEICGGDGIARCNNPDHGLISEWPGEIGRLGCPVCGHDPEHRVKGEKCEHCGGSGKEPSSRDDAEADITIVKTWILKARATASECVRMIEQCGEDGRSPSPTRRSDWQGACLTAYAMMSFANDGGAALAAIDRLSAKHGGD